MAEIKFEDKLKRLQEIVSTLENGEAALDKSIEIYEEGLKLSKELNEILSKYDEKISKINSGADNEQ